MLVFFNLSIQLLMNRLGVPPCSSWLPHAGGSGSLKLRLSTRFRPQRRRQGTDFLGDSEEQAFHQKMAKATGRETSPHVLQCLQEATSGSRRVLLTSVHGEGGAGSVCSRGHPSRQTVDGGGAYVSISGVALVGPIVPFPASGSLLNWNPTNNHVSSG